MAAPPPAAAFILPLPAYFTAPTANHNFSSETWQWYVGDISDRISHQAEQKRGEIVTAQSKAKFIAILQGNEDWVTAEKLGTVDADLRSWVNDRYIIDAATAALKPDDANARLWRKNEKMGSKKGRQPHFCAGELAPGPPAPAFRVITLEEQVGVIGAIHMSGCGCNHHGAAILDGPHLSERKTWNMIKDHFAGISYYDVRFLLRKCNH